MPARRLKPYSYIELSIETRRADGAEAKPFLCDRLAACGIGPETLAFFESRSCFRIAVYLRSFRLLERIRAGLRGKLPRGFRLKWKVLEREDWYDKWQMEYQIMPLGKRFTLVPLWQKEKYRGGRSPIYLDPKGAFGSGTHPTTQIMIALMERLEGRFDSFLDAGTGTGILCVAAKRLGAETVFAFDLDPGSVRAAKFNLRANGLAADYLRIADLFHPEFRRRFALVGANMISTVLISGRPVLQRQVRPGGYLAVSGIHLQNLAEVRKAFEGKNFRCLKILRKRGWAGLLYKKII